MTLSKKRLADAIWERGEGEFSKVVAADYLESVIGEMKSAIAREGILKIAGFGVFRVKVKGERVGKNPRTGAPIRIRGRRVVRFEVSQVLRGEINQG